MVRWSAAVLAVWCLNGLPSAGYAAITIDGYSDATNDRFTNSGSFIGGALDFSGVGQATSGRWATAISRNVVISAFHFAPSGTIRFYEGNDPASAPVQRSVISGSGIRVGGTDLWLGVLDANLPSNIAHYSFATEALSGPPPSGGSSTLVPAGSFQDLEAYVFGRSPFDETVGGDNRFAHNDQAVGRNRISGYTENVDFLGNADADSLIMLRESPGDAAYVPFETFYQSGDSGSPVFVELNGQLVLLGTAAFQLDGASGSGLNYTGNQATVINDFIVSAVPEPSSLLAVALGLLCAAGRRHRRV